MLFVIIFGQIFLVKLFIDEQNTLSELCECLDKLKLQLEEFIFSSVNPHPFHQTQSNG